MRYLKTYTSLFFVFLLSTTIYSQRQDDGISTPPIWTFFPETMYCSEVPDGMGPQWRNDVLIGQTTVEELEAIYGDAELSDRMYSVSEELEAIYGSVKPSDRMYTISGENWRIRFCANNDNVITALLVGSDLTYFQDYIAIYGIPDVVTFSTNPESRLMFWFEEGVAINVYINSFDPEYYGLVYPVIFFPYLSNENYERFWPFNHTRKSHEAVPANDSDVLDEENPFDFDAIFATITAEPSRTPEPIATESP